MVTYGIEVTEFNSEIRFDIRGHWRPLKAMPCPVINKRLRESSTELCENGPAADSEESEVVSSQQLKFEVTSAFGGHLEVTVA